MSGIASGSEREIPAAQDVSVAEVSTNAAPAESVERVANRVAGEVPLQEGIGKPVRHTDGLRNQHLLLTYAQTEVPLQFALNTIGHSKIVHGLCGVQETHANGGHHLHIYVQKSRALLSWDHVIFTWDHKVCRPNVRSLVTVEHRFNCYTYLYKEGTPVLAKEFLVPPAPVPRKRGAPSTSQDLLEVASTSSIESALSQYVSEGGDLARVGPMQRGLQVMLSGPRPPPRWEPAPLRLELRPWQQFH